MSQQKFFKMNVGIDDDVGLDETFAYAFLVLKSAQSFQNYGRY